MTADFAAPPAYSQQCPCGPDCHYAQPMTGTFGEWLWCTNPHRGGRIVREGHECRYYQAATSTDPVPPLSFKAT